MALNRSRAGFTLVELMIAVVAGSFAVAGVYYLNGVSSRAFGEQLRMSEAQMSLRSAMEQVRRDFARAGYLHTPNSALLPDCSGAIPGIADVTPRAMRALEVTRDGSTGDQVTTKAEVKSLLGMPSTNRTRADLVTLWGNYATSDAYLADPVSTSSTRIYFQPASESFRRSFYDFKVGTDVATFNATRFSSTFTNRVLRIEHEGRFFFRDITGVDPTEATPNVTINTLPGCFEPSRWTAVAPVMRVRYALESDGAADLTRLRPATASLGSRRTLLVRREVTDTDGKLVANSARVVLDYAVEFSVDAVVSTTATNATPSWAYSLGDAVTTQSTNNPERFRSLIVTLSSRSAEADPNLPFLARTTFDDATLLNSPLPTFRVFDLTQGAVVGNARVRTMRSEIFLQNL